ncbi:HflK protein [Thermosipho africanus H17ap60334]|jgi:membrane protease subunit HflK|uniref:Protein HflK n=1 Tax=Thermosipho africanus (strain TCF52B) TaxID=484019 RepID=B7IGB1_THEAB|nr:FtsH protease activity modulator HflK [Thermosipho africanus]MDK2838684.1 modulator of FtsH protease HflK [Thermosipho sp. (in: thermotogales)]ACJ75125.1 HflK protein [Thermosipho africanus TCF52B]EKF48557.1 HflK protein [Thermosipho africanus H17ap60334]MDK2900552.1 modulator of FtsH protease HflK [Thermosipho sp. (in: thermotogales)]RDI90923.1 HflK protein [Thermosipho africanus Ob7]
MWKKLIGWLVLAIIILIYLSIGVYQVGPSEVALIKTFGKYTHSTGPGIHFHLPYPFQSHVIVDVETIRKEEIGFRTIESYGKISYRTVNEEALMLTGDGNIISVEAAVQYRIKDPVKFAFNVINGKELVRFTTESVLRERIAVRTIDDVLTVERDKIALETAEKVQEILDSYDSGILINKVYLQEVAPPDQVVAAFDDVNNAKQDKERFINEATKYANDVIPKAQGQAEKILREAEAYAQKKILEAQGETQRFLSVLKEYEIAPEITKKRLILEKLQSVFSSTKNIFVLDDSGTIKLLNVNDLIGGDTK